MKSGLAICVDNYNLGKAATVPSGHASYRIGCILWKVLFLSFESEQGMRTRASWLWQELRKADLFLNSLEQQASQDAWHVSDIFFMVCVDLNKCLIRNVYCPCDVPFPTLGPLSSGVLPQNRTSHWKEQLNSEPHESFNSETDVIPLGPGKLDVDTWTIGDILCTPHSPAGLLWTLGLP